MYIHSRLFIYFSLVILACRVLKVWHLYTQALAGGMGKSRANKVLKLTPAKVKYIILEKTNNINSKMIAADTKVSIRTVNRVWSHWMKNKEPWAPKKKWASKEESWRIGYSANPENPQRAKFRSKAHREDYQAKIWQAHTA